jgi:myxalamid-type polyketide synthase MxaC
VTAQGFTAIPLARGFEALERLLRRDETQALVVPIDWETYLRRHYQGSIPLIFERLRGKDAATRDETAGKSVLLLKLEAALPGQRRPLLLDTVQRLVAEVLGETAPEAIKPRQRLFDLGIDSLMAVDMKNRLQSGLGISLGATLVFDYPTVEALVDHLLGELVFLKEPSLPSGPRSGGNPEDPGPSPADSLDAASEDEIARMLMAELEAGKGM